MHLPFSWHSARLRVDDLRLLIRGEGVYACRYTHHARTHTRTYAYIHASNDDPHWPEPVLPFWHNPRLRVTTVHACSDTRARTRACTNAGPGRAPVMDSARVYIGMLGHTRARTRTYTLVVAIHIALNLFSASVTTCGSGLQLYTHFRTRAH